MYMTLIDQLAGLNNLFTRYSLQYENIAYKQPLLEGILAYTNILGKRRKMLIYFEEIISTIDLWETQTIQSQVFIYAYIC